jgi:two-component system, OmpR family, phosphate regulon response regulator PhoB
MADYKPVKDADRPIILIVDDEMDMRIFMSTLFETSGFHPVAVRDGRQGLEKAAALEPRLIILDVMMPGEGGAMMYKALKSDPELRRIPVIMCSAVTRTSFDHYLKMLNARLDAPVPDPDGYVEKPPDPDVLLDLARNVIVTADGQDSRPSA